MRLELSIKDIFKAPRIALSFQRMWIQFIGLIFGYLFYFTFSYLALWFQGIPLNQAWHLYRLIPYLGGAQDFWYSWLVYGFGIFSFLIATLISGTAVSRASYMLLKGHNFYTWREAYKFAFRKTGSIIFALVTLLVIIMCFLIAAWLIALFGSIPWIGTIGFSLLTFIIVICSLVLSFFIILCGATILMAPSILATTDEDAFEVIFQMIAVVWHQPVRFLAYHLGGIAQSILSLTIFAFIIKRTILLFIAIYQTPVVVMQSFRYDFFNIVNQALALVQQWLLKLTLIFDGLFGDSASFIKKVCYLNNNFTLIKKTLLTQDIEIASYIVAVSLLVIGGFVIAYALTTFYAGNTIAYLVIRYKNDDLNLLDRVDLEEKALITENSSPISPEQEAE